MIKQGRTWICVYLICSGGFVVGTGCNQTKSNVASIAGEVKLDGKLLERGSIRFVPMEGVEGSITSGEIVEGRYQISGKAGPAIGWNRVEINGTRKTGRTIERPFPQRGTMEETVEAIPPQYNSTSSVKCEIKHGENTADFEVTSK